MFEIILMIGACVVMGKIASADSLSAGTAWGFVCAGLCLASLYIPLPFLRVGIAFVGTFIAMVLYKVIANK